MGIKNIAIIGMGYVGLTLSVVLAESGFNVVGVEKNKKNKKMPKCAEFLLVNKTMF